MVSWKRLALMASPNLKTLKKVVKVQLPWKKRRNRTRLNCYPLEMIPEKNKFCLILRDCQEAFPIEGIYYFFYDENAFQILKNWFLISATIILEAALCQEDLPCRSFWKAAPSFTCHLADVNEPRPAPQLAAHVTITNIFPLLITSSAYDTFSPVILITLGRKSCTVIPTSHISSFEMMACSLLITY